MVARDLSYLTECVWVVSKSTNIIQYIPDALCPNRAWSQSSYMSFQRRVCQPSSSYEGMTHHRYKFVKHNHHWFNNNLHIVHRCKLLHRYIRYVFNSHLHETALLNCFPLQKWVSSKILQHWGESTMQSWKIEIKIISAKDNFLWETLSIRNPLSVEQTIREIRIRYIFVRQRVA